MKSLESKLTEKNIYAYYFFKLLLPILTNESKIDGRIQIDGLTI